MKIKVKFLVVCFFMAICFSVSQTCFVQNTVPKVSVIIPVYKVEKYIRESLDSVVNQTLKDIEIICVDDGSPDKCPQILDEYAKKDKRIKVIHQENKGLPMARQAGIDIAKGEYIKHVDSDDYLDLKACEICYNEAKKDNVDILVHGGYRFDKSQEWVWKKYKNRLFKNQRFYFFNPSVCVGLYKNKFIKDNGITYRGIKNMAEDQSYNMLCYPAAKRIKTISHLLYHYRRDNEGSIMHVVRGKKRIKEVMENVKLIRQNWERKGYFKNEKAKIGFISWVLRNTTNLDYKSNRLRMEALGENLIDKKTINILPKNLKEKLLKVINLV